MPPSETARALEQATAGLTYESETDAPWEAFHWPGATGAPSPAGVKKQGKHKATAPATGQTVDEFFGPLIQEQDWYGDEEKKVAARYRTLLDTVKTVLTDPKVVKVGGRKATVYVVGAAKDGGWAGAKTTAVET